MRRISPRYLADRLGGFTLYKLPRDRERAVLFLRIAAGLEDPSAADKYR